MDNRRKYLNLYAEPEAGLLDSFPDCAWDYSLAIPAYRESPGFLDDLANGLLTQNSVLLIVVINQPDSEPAPHPANEKLMRRILASGEILWRSARLTLVGVDKSTSAVLLVDRFNGNPLPSNQGVGLARKIAADLALTLIYAKRISHPWLYCCDADCRLPKDYFDAIRHRVSGAANHPAALVCNFRHLCDDSPAGRATRLYELSLHHYVEGLRRAGSPYAFHTIGSTLVVSAVHYGAVRGFPRRAGGEDFYLLNKLAKTGEIISLSEPVVEIAARNSDRTPFGTGPAVEKILAMENPGDNFTVYNPVIFDRLGEWLALFPRLRQHPERIAELPDTSRQVLDEMAVTGALNHATRHSNDDSGFVRQMHIWFDGFRTLKFVRRLQAIAYPPVPVTSIEAGGPKPPFGAP